MAEDNESIIVTELHDADGAADYILLNAQNGIINLVRWNPTTQPGIDWGDGIIAVPASDDLRALYYSLQVSVDPLFKDDA